MFDEERIGPKENFTRQLTNLVMGILEGEQADATEKSTHGECTECTLPKAIIKRRWLEHPPLSSMIFPAKKTSIDRGVSQLAAFEQEGMT